MIQSESRKLHSETHKLTDFKRKETEFPYQSKEQIIVPVYNKSDREDCNNYQSISMLSLHTKPHVSSIFPLVLDKSVGVVNMD
jgi:hypothetical protein